MARIDLDKMSGGEEGDGAKRKADTRRLGKQIQQTASCCVGWVRQRAVLGGAQCTGHSRGPPLQTPPADP